MDSESISHHGIMGMKWGVRRYQNKDGTLTPAGKKHVSQKGNSSSNSNESKPARKFIKDMSDEELNSAIRRLELEKKYKSLLIGDNKKKAEKGRQIIYEILEKSGKNIATQLTTYALGTAINKAFGENVVNPKKGQKDK